MADCGKVPFRLSLLSSRLPVFLSIVVSARYASAAEIEPAAFKTPVAAISGSLVVCGGGNLPDRVYEEFLKLAGGAQARIVVIPTASAAADSATADPNQAEALLAPWRERKADDVVLLHTRNRARADDPAFVEPLRKATGVWFGGGSQSRIVAAYRGTAVERELKKLLERAGVIGGTSAGAAVMSDVMIAGDSENVAPLPKIDRGFGFLPGAIVDQHYSARDRQDRLAAAVDTFPGRVGFGIDEATALVVRGRELQVVGDGAVHVVIDPLGNRAIRLRLREHVRDDLVALSRAAIARLGEPFPPEMPTPPRVGNGSLVIVGGGGMPETIRQKFIELAGGPEAKIVVIPTANERPAADMSDYRFWTNAGAKNVVVLHAASRAEADSPELLAKLKDAGGVWFGGGRQWRFVDAYENTKCYEAFHEVLRRGGVIGGSSAGATIQGDYLVRGSPLGNTIMMADGYERGFAFLPGTAIDQHFTQRNRQPDMEAVKRRFPQLLGLGIDEATAVVVQETRFEVLGTNTVSVYPPAAPTANDSSEIIVASPQVLKAGEQYDLEKFEIVHSP